MGKRGKKRVTLNSKILKGKKALSRGCEGRERGGGGFNKGLSSRGGETLGEQAGGIRSGGKRNTEGG